MHETFEQIRTRFRRWVNSRCSDQAECPCEESFLLKNGMLHGCRFTIGQVNGTWIIGESTMEVRGPGQSDTLVIAPLDDQQRAA